MAPADGGPPDFQRRVARERLGAEVDVEPAAESSSGVARASATGPGRGGRQG
jgi:hypothetical protein